MDYTFKTDFDTIAFYFNFIYHYKPVLPWEYEGK
jgi:hypothetical protein